MPLAADGENVVLTRSGWGDGQYPVVQTLDPNGLLLAVHVDLLVVSAEVYENEADKPDLSGAGCWRGCWDGSDASPQGNTPNLACG